MTAPTPSVDATESPTLAPSPAPSISPSATPTPSTPSLDMAALHERKDPERLLRFYAEALRQGRWALAARAWHRDSGVTAATLRQSYDRGGGPVSLTFGKAEQDGACGSIYYEAPVTLRIGNGAPQRGMLILRRVNDVDGATAEQLNWHIERSTIGATP